MADYDPAFYTAVNGLITTTWGIPAARILTVNQADMINWQNEVELETLVAPFCIMMVHPSYEEVWAMDLVCYRYPLTLFYIRNRNLTAPEAAAGSTIRSIVEAQLAAMRAAFRAYTGDAFQLAANFPTKDVSADNPANAIFAGINTRFFAGGFEVAPLVGE